MIIPFAYGLVAGYLAGQYWTKKDYEKQSQLGQSSGSSSAQCVVASVLQQNPQFAAILHRIAAMLRAGGKTEDYIQINLYGEMVKKYLAGAVTVAQLEQLAAQMTQSAPAPTTSSLPRVSVMQQPSSGVTGARVFRRA